MNKKDFLSYCIDLLCDDLTPMFIMNLSRTNSFLYQHYSKKFQLHQYARLCFYRIPPDDIEKALVYAHKHDGDLFILIGNEYANCKDWYITGIMRTDQNIFLLCYMMGNKVPILPQKLLQPHLDRVAKIKMNKGDFLRYIYKMFRHFCVPDIIPREYVFLQFSRTCSRAYKLVTYDLSNIIRRSLYQLTDYKEYMLGVKKMKEYATVIHWVIYRFWMLIHNVPICGTITRTVDSLQFVGTYGNETGGIRIQYHSDIVEYFDHTSDFHQVSLADFFKPYQDAWYLKK